MFMHEPALVVITPEKASQKCSDLGLNSLLLELNTVQSSSLNLDHPGLKSLLKSFISHNYDFGTAYSRIRSIWPRWPSPSGDLSQNLKNREKKISSNEKKRRNSVSNDVIHNPHAVMPRRLWDLYAHRTIPYDYGGIDVQQAVFWAVSHSWTDDMTGVKSPVNAFEWPVPLPRGVTLENVRAELLNMGAEYVWLDVLCLRQMSTEHGETLRAKEWAIDVPTIGNIYTDGAFRVVRYFNGLGRAFRRDGWNDSRHWLNRAWTLQEIKYDSVNAGVPAHINPLIEKSDDDGSTLGDRLAPILELELFSDQSADEENFIRIIEEMRRRYSTNPVDKIAGIGTLLRCPTLPVYKETQTPKDAFKLCVQHMHLDLIGRLLFLFPIPGDDGCAWRPSWKQLMSKKTIIRPVSYSPVFSKIITLTKDGYVHNSGPVFDARFLPPLTMARNKRLQRARIVVKEGKVHEEFSVLAVRDALPTEGLYSMVGDRSMECWVLCRKTINGLKKVSTLYMDPEEKERLRSTFPCKNRMSTLV